MHTYGNYSGSPDVYSELKDMLCDELEKVTKKGELSAGSLDVVDKLTHSIKSIETIMAMNGYSGAARHRDAMGRYSGRYSRGYSRDKDEFMAELHELMESAPDETTRHEIRRVITKMENV